MLNLILKKSAIFIKQKYNADGKLMTGQSYCSGLRFYVWVCHQTKI